MFHNYAYKAEALLRQRTNAENQPHFPRLPIRAIGPDPFSSISRCLHDHYTVSKSGVRDFTSPSFSLKRSFAA